METPKKGSVEEKFKQDAEREAELARERERAGQKKVAERIREGQEGGEEVDVTPSEAKE